MTMSTTTLTQTIREIRNSGRAVTAVNGTTRRTSPHIDLASWAVVDMSETYPVTSDTGETTYVARDGGNHQLIAIRD